MTQNLIYVLYDSNQGDYKELRITSKPENAMAMFELWIMEFDLADDEEEIARQIMQDATARGQGQYELTQRFKGGPCLDIVYDWHPPKLS